MQDKFCEMHLPNGKIVKLSYKKFLALAGGVACAFAVAVGSAGYFIINWLTIVRKHLNMLNIKYIKQNSKLNCNSF